MCLQFCKPTQDLPVTLRVAVGHNKHPTKITYGEGSQGEVVIYLVDGTPGAPIPPGDATLKFDMVFVEVPKNHIYGFHNLISKALFDGTTVVIHGTETDATSYGCQLRDTCDVESLHVLRLALYNTRMFTLHNNMHVTTMLLLAHSLTKVCLHAM